MMITEPTTMLTDYLLTLACLCFSYKLLVEAIRRKQDSIRLWGIGFLVVAVAALIGGSFHGFADLLDEGTLKAMWNLTVFLMGLTGGLMVSGTLVGLRGRADRASKWLIRGLIVTLIGFGIQQSGVVFHAHFNHNDLFHLIQLCAFYLLYRGAFLLKDH